MFHFIVIFCLFLNAAINGQQEVQHATDVSLPGAIELNMMNLDTVLKSAQVVFVAFCADWCPFSRKLKPVFDESAKHWNKEYPNTVVWAIVDSVAQADVADKYFVNKYPTMKVFINGELIKNEYRSTRTVEALTEFVKKQIEVSINEFSTVEQLNGAMNAHKRNVIGYFHCRDCQEYQNFQKIAALLRDDCAFWIGKDAAVNGLTESHLMFKDPDMQDQQKYTGGFLDYDFLKNWLSDKCVPLVREVTFENVEELTEEGLPFLLFFRDPNDKNGERMFIDAVIRELYDQKTAVNALLADGHKFAHPLKHLGKTSKDLPVLAIDSFQHMFLFDDATQLPVPGKLRQFVMDLHSGELHKRFHETLDQRIAELQKRAQEALEEAMNGRVNDDEPKPPSILPQVDTSPLPSIFKELKPSGKRYSILQKTEL